MTIRSSCRAEAGMAHEIAKLILEHADTFVEREEAIRTAISLGMPLEKIEEYLDWVDHHCPLPPEQDAGDPSAGS